ncbi:hypothetical protein BUE93_20885 [Chromobacterium amazonense]|uniref:Uncharacterized protein n=1 Tax=Chromobacterium amazonense TaxID=1382803 RepID=A0A2S9WZ23_9NEIS|nr:hypothetical protein [Chromobacterium amazonense]PRP68722.1 hypothetical protein BUE93_20885 [Chromobacterium amazonense]
MTRYSKRISDGVTAHYNSAEELQKADSDEFESKVRGIGLMIGLVGGGWLTWSAIMAHGGAEWPKLLRLIVTLMGAAVSGGALYYLSVYIVLTMVAVTVGWVIWGGLKWLWNAI